MHIVALIEKHEHVLCSLRFYKGTGLLCATPGFSTLLVDPENDPDVLVKGAKLSTYRLTGRLGSQYEYAVDNTSDLWPLASAEDLRLARELQLQEEKRDRVEVARWQQTGRFSKSTTKGLNGAENSQKGMMLSLEVVAVDSPQTIEAVCVEYELTLPHHGDSSHWRFQPGNAHRKQGKTPLSLPHASARPGHLTAATFGWHETFSLKLHAAEGAPFKSESQASVDKEEDIDGLPAPPVLHVSVYSQDSWKRKRTEGHGELRLPSSSGFYDFDVPIRKPIVSICDQMEELFLGLDETNADYNSNDERAHNHKVCGDDSPLWTAITSRLGQKSESTATTVRIRLNVVELHPQQHSEGHAAVHSMPVVATAVLASNRVVKRSVHEILQSVRLEKRVTRATELPTALRPIPAGGIAAVESSPSTIEEAG
ncbi:hypothetical protein BBJ28_00007611 [Nothophytophthora sp. Chile5]|nr:hypothetical protein BBJ28_00007611 [Nothophytophthora sp. Chile5]